MYRDLSPFPCTVLSRVPLSPRIRQSTNLFLSLSSYFVCLSFSLSISRDLFILRFLALLSTSFCRPQHAHPEGHVPRVRLFLFFSAHLLLSPFDSPSVRGTNRRVPRDTLVSRALAGEKSRNDVTLLGRNRESRVNPDRRDHPVRQEPKVFLDTRADKGFQARSAHQARRARPGRSGPLVRRERQELRVLR